MVVTICMFVKNLKCTYILCSNYTSTLFHSFIVFIADYVTALDLITFTWLGPVSNH